MSSFSCNPLSGRGNEIFVNIKNERYHVNWGNNSLSFPKEIIVDIMDNFFQTPDWYPLGASMDSPINGGLGEYIQKSKIRSPLKSPRYASMIAPIMVYQNLITYRTIGKSIELKKIV